MDLSERWTCQRAGPWFAATQRMIEVISMVRAYSSVETTHARIFKAAWGYYLWFNRFYVCFYSVGWSYLTSILPKSSSEDHWKVILVMKLVSPLSWALRVWTQFYGSKKSRIKDENPPVRQYLFSKALWTRKVDRLQWIRLSHARSTIVTRRKYSQ
jgi:hypothetical protein